MATKSPPKPKSASQTDVYSLLKADHQKVQKMFEEFEKLHEQEGHEEELTTLGMQICNDLTIHAQVEEELFYPALMEKLEDQDLIDEAEVEHECAKTLIETIQDEGDDDEAMFAARIIVLGEYVNHHIDEEQRKLFPAAKKAKIDAEALGEVVARRMEELRAEMAGGESAGSMEEDDEDEEIEDDEEETVSARASRSSDGGRPAHERTG